MKPILKTNVPNVFFGGGGGHHVAYSILFPQPGIEPTPPAVEALSLNHWTAREVPNMPNADKDVEQLELSYTTSGNVKWYIYFGK